MRLSKPRAQSALGMNLTPMIDIVFLLIIFFITVSQITPIINHPLELPEAALKSDTLPRVQVTINIDQAGNYFVAGNSYSLDALQLWLASQRASAQSGESFDILIRCDRRTPSRFVNQLIPVLSGLGMQQVKISVQGER